MTTGFQRFLSVLLVFLFGAQLFYTGLQSLPEEEVSVEVQPLRIWYTDPDIQGYMEAAAADLSAQYGLEVTAELVSEVDYIEEISEQSVAEEMTGPDLYVASSALLEKATLAGLTYPADTSELSAGFPEKAVQAVTYDGTPVAWPFYIETSFLLYNRYYVEEEELPDTIDDILSYAENFEADETTSRVENIFKWNVADVIDNYMFLGAYTDLGGSCGDDKALVSLDIASIEECMDYYQSLSEYFAIDADTVTSDEVIQEFIEGKTVFTIVNVPMLSELDQAAEDGEIPDYEGADGGTFYGILPLPDLTDELSTRGLSVTNAVVVNPYSQNRELAETAAKYLTLTCSGALYPETGKVPAHQTESTEAEAASGEARAYVMDYEPLYEKLPDGSGELSGGSFDAVYQAYEEAAEVPKIMELSNIWLQLEVVLADIWRGEDAGEELEGFSELLAGQLD